MSNVVRIQSSKTIVVTSGLQFDDVTNPDAHIPDRLKVSAVWPKHSIMIKEGVDLYPAEIAEWATVKSLVDAGVFTLAFVEGEAKKEDIEKVEEVKEEKRKKKAKALKELAEE